MTGYIYVIINDVNGKLYVGKTTDTLLNRFSEHCKDSVLEHCKGRPLYHAMNKYGKEHFHIELLEECDLGILSLKELEWINKLDTYHNGYNATLGGEGKLYYNYDLFVNDFNSGLNIREIAEKYKCNPETISKVLRKLNLDTTRGLHIQRRNDRQSVLLYSMNDEFIQEFESYWAAAQWIIDNNYTKVPNQDTIRKNISGAAKQREYRKSAYGFKWKLTE